MNEIFKLVGRIALEGSKAVQDGLDGIDRKVKGTESGLNSFSKGMTAVGHGATNAGKSVSAFISLPAAGALAFASKSAMDFEHAVDQIGAVANATESEMAGLSDTALRIGKDTAFGATEAAGAMEILAANGVSAADIMSGAADAAVALAAAGGTTLATAADTASTSMAIWGLKTSDMAEVVNRLAGAANVSRFGVEDMSGAIAQGGGAAESAGVEFGDFATAIAATASSFSSGSDAGTSFKQFLTGLSPTTDKQIGLMKELGLMTADGSNKFYDAQGNLKSMAEITDLLNRSTAGLTEEQRKNAFVTLFGSDAQRTAAALSKLTGDEFTAMSEKMKNTDAQEVAARRMGNLKGGMEQLGGAIETLSIQFGQVVAPFLAKFVEGLTGAITAVSNLPAPMQALIVGIVAGLAALGPVLIVLGQLMTAIGAIGPVAVAVAPKLAVLWAAILGPVGLIIAALAAFGVAYATNFLGFRDTVQAVAGVVLHWISQIDNVISHLLGLDPSAYGSAWEAFGAQIQHVLGLIMGLLAPIREEFAKTFAVIGPEIAATFQVIAATIATVLGEIIGYISAHREQFIAIFGGMWQQLQGIFEVAWALFSGAIRIALAVLRGDWEGAWNILQETVQRVLSGLEKIVQGTLQQLQGIFDLALAPIVDGVRQRWEEIQSTTQSVWDAIVSYFSGKWEEIKGTVEGVANWIGDKIQWLYDHNRYFRQFVDEVKAEWEELQQITSDIWNAIGALISGIITDIQNVVNAVVPPIVAFIADQWQLLRSDAETAWNALVAFIRGIFEGIATDIRNAAGTVSAAASEVWAAIESSVGGLVEKARGWGANVIGEFVAGVRSQIPDVGAAANDAATAVWDFLGFESPTKKGPGRNADKWGANFVKMFADSMRNESYQIEGAATDIAARMQAFINKAIQAGLSQSQIEELTGVLLDAVRAGDYEDAFDALTGHIRDLANGTAVYGSVATGTAESVRRLTESEKAAIAEMRALGLQAQTVVEAVGKQSSAVGVNAKQTAEFAIQQAAATKSVGTFSGALGEQFTQITKLADVAGKGGQYIGWELINGIIDGVKKNGSNLYNEVYGVVQSAIDAAKRAAGIASPSSVARDDIGVPIGEGIGVGVERGLRTAMEPVTGFLQRVSRSASKTISQVSNTVANAAIGGNGAGGMNDPRFMAPRNLDTLWGAVYAKANAFGMGGRALDLQRQGFNPYNAIEALASEWQSQQRSALGVGAKPIGSGTPPTPPVTDARQVHIHIDGGNEARIREVVGGVLDEHMGTGAYENAVVLP